MYSTGKDKTASEPASQHPPCRRRRSPSLLGRGFQISAGSGAHPHLIAVLINSCIGQIEQNCHPERSASGVKDLVVTRQTARSFALLRMTSLKPALYTDRRTAIVACLSLICYFIAGVIIGMFSGPVIEIPDGWSFRLSTLAKVIVPVTDCAVVENICFP